MVKLSDNAKELCNIINQRDVDKDSFIGIMLTLKTEENFKKMLDWLRINKNAKQSEIINQLYNFV